MFMYLSNFARSAGDPKVVKSGPSSLGSSDRLARGMGWFSLALGATELFAPRLITGALGMRGAEGLIRAYGLREIVSGMLALSPDKNVGMWSRVGGDALDIATLLTGLNPENPKRHNVRLALGLVLGVTLLDIIGAQGTTRRHSGARGQKRLYHDRTGFPGGVQAAKGAATRDFQIPNDMRAAPLLAGVSRMANGTTTGSTLRPANS
jgi:hypothetical protein